MNRRLAASIPTVLAAALVATACEPPKITVPGAQLSGTVTIAAALKPLLPPPAGQQGTVVAEKEPDTIVGQEKDDLGTLNADGPPLIVNGDINGATCSPTNDCRDVYEITLDKDASITLTLSPTGGSGAGFFLLSTDPTFNTQRLISQNYDGATPAIASARVKANTPPFEAT